MQTTWFVAKRGFTISELIIVIVTLAILASIVAVVYVDFTRKAAESSLMAALKQVLPVMERERVHSAAPLKELPTSIRSKEEDDITLRLVSTGGPYYTGLSPVQNAVLFYDICWELVADPEYQTIHAREGGDTQTLFSTCDPGGTSTVRTKMTIQSWASLTPNVPVTRSFIQAEIDSIPYDSWWIDRQEVARKFYTELIDRFEGRGGTWPITTFWDHWATSTNGVLKQELPPLPAGTEAGYCVVAEHKKYPDMLYSITDSDAAPREGGC